MTARLARIALRHGHTAAGRDLARVIAEDHFSGHWCLMWDAGPFHVTHKYLGHESEVDRRDVDECAALVNEYFRVKRPVAGTWTFDRPDRFGPDKDVHVLRRDPSPDMMLDLRDDLDLIIPDKWSEYRPHVTCDSVYKAITIRPERYVLACGEGNFVREWAC